jgi:hypothetical protein
MTTTMTTTIRSRHGNSIFAFELNFFNSSPFASGSIVASALNSIFTHRAPLKSKEMAGRTVA